jgi:hypothetical protein
VVWWAALGGLMAAFIAWVLIRWITSPYFKAVDPGPSKLPSGQHEALLAIQIGGSALALFCIYWTLVRPWLRERRVASEGLLVLTYGTLYFQDPFSNAGNYWFIFNSHMWNRGSWVNQLPLFSAWGGTPGHMQPEPIFGMGPGYVYFWLIGIWAGTVAFKFGRKRFPRLGLPGAIITAYLGIFIFDVILEPFIWMRTGFFSYAGAPGPKIFEGSYLAFPLLESAMIGVMLVPWVLLRHYRDDRGYTVVERGIDRVRAGGAVKTVLRFLALLAVSQFLYFFCYNIWGYVVGVHASAYPQEVLSRSQYLGGGWCGPWGDRMCPGPAVPMSVDRSVYINIHGGVGCPPGTELLVVPPAGKPLNACASR